MPPGCVVSKIVRSETEMLASVRMPHQNAQSPRWNPRSRCTFADNHVRELFYVSLRTVKRDWEKARMLLLALLGGNAA